jgi:diacylglycerol kinase family enzyme
VNTMSQLTIMINATVRGLGKQAMPDWLADLFQAHGMEGAIWFAHRGPELVALARKAAHQAGETVAAGGSNGTINTVASALLGTNKVLSVLPLGTLNHIAKDLQIPLALNRRYKPH